MKPMLRVMLVVLAGLLSVVILLGGFSVVETVQAQSNWEKWSQSKKTVLVELFTSQGCSSCPPADELLSEISKHASSSGSKLYALSYHVDYWNYLGWKDPYSDTGATKRQYQYRQVLSNTSAYTPQVVVNGLHQFVGSSRMKMVQALNTEFGKGQDSAKLKYKKHEGEKLKYTFFGYNKAQPTLLRIAYIASEKTNAVPRGENSGRTLSHTNVVEQLDSFAFTNEELALELRRAPSLDSPIIAFLQDPENLEVLSTINID